MRDLRLLLLSGMGVAGVVAIGACATEAQEPGVNRTGLTSGLTSDSGSDTDTGTETNSNTNTSTSTQAVTSGPVTTTTNTTGDADDTTTETATTGPLPLGGTITETSGASTTGNAATTGNVSTSTTTSVTTATTTATSSGENSNGNGGMGGMTSFGGFTATTATTTTGGGSCTATPATAPVALEPDDGWIDCSTNDIGIQGEFFTYSDGTSTITSAFTGDEICVEGTAGQAVSDNSVWGAGLGVNLNQEEREADLDTWNADAMGISGFRFNLSDMPGTGLRLVYQSAGTDYCVEITSAGAQTVLFSETREACWGSGGDDPNPSTLEAVKWQVTTNSSEHDFSFCIAQFAAIP